MLNELISLIYPNNCICCNQNLARSEKHICLICASELPKTNYIKNPENPVSKLFWGSVELSIGYASLKFGKNGKVQDLIHQLKYKGKKDVGEYLGLLMGKEIKENGNSFDAIVPVPLHPKKERIRGFNQSYYVAKGISQFTEIPILEKSIIRTSNTDSQTRKSKYDRWKNVSAIFKVIETESIIGKHILLVDDVITTGSTLGSCAKELLKTEGVKVSIGAAACSI